MSIQWYPGHMVKAFRQVKEKLKLVNLVFELVDARLPVSSRNPKVDELVKGKKRLILLTKSDLADPNVSAKWVSLFQSKKDDNILLVDIQSGEGMNKILHVCDRLMHDEFEKREVKGIKSKSTRVLVMGIPNVGKSSLINRLAKRHAAATGNKPGVTKAQQWIRVGKSLELLDTPGVLWPKFDHEGVAMSLAISGAIKDNILPIEEVAHYFISFIIKWYPELLSERYQLDMKEVYSKEAYEIMLEIGGKRGCIQKGGEVNIEKTSEIILKDFRAGRIGRITLEFPGDNLNES